MHSVSAHTYTHTTTQDLLCRTRRALEEKDEDAGKQDEKEEEEA